jgi:hypothetical protein
MEHKQDISVQEVEIHAVFRREPEKWLTNAEVRKAIKSVAPRTVAEHTRRHCERGILDKVETFPSFRYRLARKPDGAAYRRKVEEAAAVFGIEL